MSRIMIAPDFDAGSPIQVTIQENEFIIEYMKDHSHRRAAKAAGFKPSDGIALLEQENVTRAIAYLSTERLEMSNINASWVLDQLVDNHNIARQSGDIKASTQALGMIAKHSTIDAFAADKVQHEPITISINGQLADV